MTAFVSFMCAEQRDFDPFKLAVDNSFVSPLPT